MRKSKNRYFFHTLVSPGNTPGAITQNVPWMERQLDAYTLCRCMYLSNYNRLWDIGEIDKTRRAVIATAKLIGMSYRWENVDIGKRLSCISVCERATNSSIHKKQMLCCRRWSLGRQLTALSETGLPVGPSVGLHDVACGHILTVNVA